MKSKKQRKKNSETEESVQTMEASEEVLKKDWINPEDEKWNEV